MAKTVTCLFSSEDQASSIVSRLEDSGLSQGKVCVFSNTNNNRFWDDAPDFDNSEEGADHDRVAHYLRNNGVPDDDARAYAEGVRRGHTLVAVRCDDDEVDQVVGLLDDDDILDLDERQETWRSEGWSGYGSGAGGIGGASETSATTMSDASMGGQRSIRDEDHGLSTAGGHLRGADLDRGDEIIPVAEEELHVGKREVSHGRVRIRSHVTERPVQEQVTLSEERVQVERRPVAGLVHGGSLGDNNNLFQERTIEVEERGEEAVVSKEARVVEEVVVRKEADQRTETVSDTVRKTEIEVEDERRDNPSRTGTTDGTR
jgi:uncharacterized protein (TIGR02271 family)